MFLEIMRGEQVAAVAPVLAYARLACSGAGAWRS